MPGRPTSSNSIKFQVESMKDSNNQYLVRITDKGEKIYHKSYQQEPSSHEIVEDIKKVFVKAPRKETEGDNKQG